MTIEQIVEGIKLWIRLYELGHINTVQLAEALEVGVSHLRTKSSN